MSAIAFDGVTKEYGAITAVSDLDLDIGEGEIFGFLGPNGAGKTTAINILLDLVRATTGTVTVLGHDAATETVAVKRKMGVLPENFDVWDRLSGWQHVQFAIDSKRANRRGYADEILERVGLAEDAHRRAGDYSKGMKQRLALGMALVGDPEVLILDEPTTGLDPTGARQVREIVREENERGATVFFSSHILGQVEAVCDRVGIIRDGTLVADDTVQGLRNSITTESQLTVRVDPLTNDVQDAVASIAGVESVSVDGSDLQVAIDEGDKASVISAIEDAGSEVVDFQTEEASLEDLFMAYAEGEMAA
jgi:ABC-2 type transport system ATP-binding protein